MKKTASHTPILLLSEILAFLFPAVLIALCFLVPTAVDSCENLCIFLGDSFAKTDRILFFTVGYLSIAAAAAADVLLILLLFRTKHGLVFTAQSAKLTGGISACLFAVGAFFAVIGVSHLLALLVTFGCIFLGIALLVVRNVLFEGAVLKDENDLTV